MKLALIGFVLRRVRMSLWQLRWSHLLTAMTMSVTLFVFGAFLVLQINLEHWLKGLGDEIQMTAYLAQNLAPLETQSLLERVRATPEVERVRLISQEQAWRDFQAALGAQSSLLEGLPADVLPASLEIAFKPAHRDGPVMERVAERLRGEKEISGVDYPQEWADRLEVIALAAQWAKWTLGGLLFLATFFIVGSTVKLALLARKDEIEIMQLVGASEELIQAPFVIEGMIQGLVAGGIAMAALWGAFVMARSEILTFVGFLAPLARPQFLDSLNIAFILAVGWLLGAAGSVFSLRRFLKTWKSSRGEA
ncbi:MAG: cell division protein FtsX [Candidatus Binatia bacterium]